MSILEVQHLTHGFADKQLYQDTGFQLNKGEHMAIVGQNGIGKSTLIKILTGEQMPDEGKIQWQKNLHIGYLDQYAQVDPTETILSFLKSAFISLYQKADELTELYTDPVAMAHEQGLEKAGNIQEYLEAHHFYELDTIIEKVAHGLGISTIGLDRTIQTLSGGQRSKVILGKLLLESPDVLLLDEPTNFLDVSHIQWLIDYLVEFAGSFIVVSHDYDFLDQIANCICDIEFGSMNKYRGNLQSALKQKKEQKEHYLKMYEAQQQKIQKTEAYIRKYKAGSRSTMAKSRQKQLDRIERLTPPSNAPKPDFVFPYQPNQTHIVLTATDLEIGYEKPLLPQLNFSISNHEKVVIKGFNGIGKSTLLKTLLNKISPLAGEIDLADTIKINYFEQGLNWPNVYDTPLKVIEEAFPKLKQKEIRSKLARCGIAAENCNKALHLLSGGEQIKVKLCYLTIQPSNLLVLDEPTNHLDDETKQALQTELINFEGTVLLVSHEESFYSSWADRIIDIEEINVL